MTIKVDLLPTEKKRFGIDPVWIVLVLVIILCTVVFFVYGKSLETSIQSKEQEVHKVETEISDLRGKLPGIAKMKTDNEKLSSQIDTIKGLKNDPVRYANLLWEIAEILPSNVWVTSINIEPTQTAVTLTGHAVEYGGQKPLESIAQTMRAFQNSRYFKDATLSSTSSGEQIGLKSFSFQLETHYDQGAALKSPEELAPRTSPSAAPGGASAPAPGTAAPGGEAAAPPADGGAPAGTSSGAPNAGAPSGK